VLGEVKKRFRLAVVRVRQRAVLELDHGRLTIDDVGYFRHIGSSFEVRRSAFWFYTSSTLLPASAARTERFIMTPARCSVASFSARVHFWIVSRSLELSTIFSPASTE